LPANTSEIYTKLDLFSASNLPPVGTSILFINEASKSLSVIKELALTPSPVFDDCITIVFLAVSWEPPGPYSRSSFSRAEIAKNWLSVVFLVVGEATFIKFTILFEICLFFATFFAL